MITVTNRDNLRLLGSPTAMYEGRDHGAGVSLFWVDSPPGSGPDFHWHPYTETWVVLQGEARIEAGEDRLRARTGYVVTIPAETVHRFRSCGSGNLQMLCIHASPTIIQTFVESPPRPSECVDSSGSG